MPLFKSRIKGLSKKGIDRTAVALNTSSQAIKSGRRLVIFPGMFALLSRKSSVFTAAIIAMTIGNIMQVSGITSRHKVLAKCVGHPRAAREIAKRLKFPTDRALVFLFGYGKFNESERASILAHRTWNASTAEKNMAMRALERESKRLKESGEYDNFLKEYV